MESPTIKNIYIKDYLLPFIQVQNQVQILGPIQLWKYINWGSDIDKRNTLGEKEIWYLYT